jgi:hypothetical protein
MVYIASTPYNININIIKFILRILACRYVHYLCALHKNLKFKLQLLYYSHLHLKSARVHFIKSISMFEGHSK